jgi:hypothetical protein
MQCMKGSVCSFNTGGRIELFYFKFGTSFVRRPTFPVCQADVFLVSDMCVLEYSETFFDTVYCKCVIMAFIKGDRGHITFLGME